MVIALSGAVESHFSALGMERRSAAWEQTCRLVPKHPPISTLAQRRELARYPALSACNRLWHVKPPI